MQLALPISISLAWEAAVALSPERRATAKTTRGNYPALVHLFSPHKKKERCKKNNTDTRVLYAVTATHGLLNNDAY